MVATPWFKLASRIVCLAILTSAALWLNASARADGARFDCVLTADNKNGGMVLLTCGTSGGDFLWNCGGGSCTSDPQMDTAASQDCANYAVNGCPPTNYLN